MKGDDLLSTARRLARASPQKPRQADLRRAVSTAYYALFHAIAHDAADLFAGAGGQRSEAAWTHAYRSLDHGFAKGACQRVRGLGFPSGLCACADAFVTLQVARHDADYDPALRLSRADALTHVALAEEAIAQLRAAERADRRAFAILLLLKRRP